MKNNFIFTGIDYKRNIEDFVNPLSKIKYKDCISSDIAVRHNITNVPSEEQWQNIELLVEKIIDPLMRKFTDINIISFFRTPILSAIMGSSTSSNHCKGCAIDFYFNENNKIVLEYIVKNLIFHELIFSEIANSWIHISFKDNSRAKTIKIKDQTNKTNKINLEDFLELIKS